MKRACIHVLAVVANVLCLQLATAQAAPAVHIVKFVNGQDADSPTGPHVLAGSTVTFTYVVTNTGTVPLSSVVVTDDKLGPITSFTGDTNGNGFLDLTETWTYTMTATALAGQQTNVGTVTGMNSGTTVIATNPANYFGDAPAVHIVKFVNGQDADAPTGPHVPVGSTVTFTYVVTNTGNVPLANVAVTDDKLGAIAGPSSGDTNANGLLDLTETWVYTKTATALAGQQTNVGTATAHDANNPPGSTVTANNPANYFGDAPIHIVKFVNGQDADIPPGPHVVAGSTVTFTYVVTNTGTVPLANVVVTDDKLGAIAGPASGDANNNGLLDLTETWTYTKTATALAGQQTNIGTVTATSNGIPVTASNPANYFGDALIHIVKFVNGQDADTLTGPHVAAGSTLTFTYVVTNTGTNPLASVVVTDNKLGIIAGPASGDTNANGMLDLTETWTYTKTATALAGQQTNIGTVTATSIGTPVTASNPANYFGDAPAVHIVESVNGQDADTPTGPTVTVGSTLTFTYVVTNTGNVPLANVAVTDDKLGTITSFTGDTNANGMLDPTETWTYTKTATALAGQQTNTGTATAQDANNPPGSTVTASNPANYFGGAQAIAQVPTLSPLGTMVLASLLALVAAMLLWRGTTS